MHREWKPDPGPCPVDDAPHHTCTSPDYVPAGGPITVTVWSMRARARLAREAQAREREARDPPPVTFSTVTYDRKKARAKLRT
jgi:hypothetical protein